MHTSAAGPPFSGKARTVGLALLLCSSPSLRAGEVSTLPPAPVFLSDVHAFEQQDGEYVFSNPYIPPVSNSRDQRIGLIRKLGSGDQARFTLFAPEGLTSPVGELNGAAILGDLVELDASQLHNAQSTEDYDASIGHFALCDAQGSNPRVCGDRDCYELDVIVGVSYTDADPADGVDLPSYVEMWSRSVTVQVTDPKTAGASLEPVQVNGSGPRGPVTIQGLAPLGIETFHTPMISDDGRLLVVRLGSRTELQWQDAGGQSHSGRYDAVYAYSPTSAGKEPCDISGWTDFKPVAYAPFDSEVSSRYGFAANPFRSPSGIDIVEVDGQGNPVSVPELRARYLWLDDDADNLFFAGLSRMLHKDYRGDGSCGISGDCFYQIECWGGLPCDLSNAGKQSEQTAPHQGWMMAGLWTHGKMVLLDSAINHSDFGLDGEQDHHRMVTLYQDDPHDPNDQPAVRVGTGRDATPIAKPHGWIDTTVQLGSTQHFFNMVDAMKPRTPRDVVWHVTAGAKTDEIAFDDYISHRTLIFSPMNALKEMARVPSQVVPGTFGYPYYDGHEPVVPGETLSRFPEMRLQNAATGFSLQVPAYGEVVAAAGEARIEHVALGGIKGRGFYLYPGTGIRYDIPYQTGLDDEEWVAGLFFNQHHPAASVRRLLTFPNGDFIDLHGVWKTRICVLGSGCSSVRLPNAQTDTSWTHLAYHFDGARVRILQNGFLFAEVDMPLSLALTPGTSNLLTVGSPDAATLGVEGWIDELRLVAGSPNLEELCNHARGTLLAIPSDYRHGSGRLADILEPFANAAEDFAADSPENPTLYPNFLSGRLEVHKALYGLDQAASWPTSDYYVCNVDYTTAKGISVHDPGDPEARPIRRRMLFPEGPVVWNQPRPESVSNGFCTTCHHADGQGGLGMEALTLDTVPAHDDTRRQPSKAPAVLLGHLPAQYFGHEPEEAAVDVAIDRWVHNGPLYRWTFDEAAGSTFDNWVIGDVSEPDNGGSRGQAIYRPGADLDNVGRGHALRFDGLDDVAGVAHGLNFHSEALTLAAWFRAYRTDTGGPPPASEDQCRVAPERDSPCTLIAKSKGDVYWSLQVFYQAVDDRWRARLRIRGADNVLETLEVDLDDVNTPVANDFNPAVWHHLVGTYGNGRLELYLDGASMGSLPIAPQILATSPSHPVTLGAELDAGGQPVAPFFGRIDDVRVYDRILRTDEILELSVP